jgi:hypothetical protein
MQGKPSKYERKRSFRWNPIYFTEQDVETCRLRKKMETLPKEVRTIRNNVEATIFQLGYHYRSGKSTA